MKKVVVFILIGISVTVLGCSNHEDRIVEEKNVETGVNQQSEIINEDVNVKIFSELVAQPGGQILDVRTPDEWADGIIKGAIKMNFYDDNYKTQLAKLDKEKPVYVYCKSGGRSGQAAAQMKEMGFTIVYNLDGGISAWENAGKETVK